MNAVPAVPIGFEGKVLDIDPTAVAHRIVAAGGRQTGERRMRRLVHDVVPCDTSRWLRLRDDGRRVTLAYKQVTSEAIDGTREIEIGVDDFATTDALLTLIGRPSRSYQETRRVGFVLDGAELEIDFWPRIPPYLEIEAGSRDEVVRVAGRLGYRESELTGENTVAVYARHGIDLTTIADLRF